MDTQYVGTSAGAALGAAQRYRLTLVADAGLIDGARFAARAQSVWDGLASSGLGFPSTRLTVTPEDKATTFDIKTSTAAAGRIAAELVRWVSERTGGGIHLVRLERLADLTGQSVHDEAARARVTTSAEEQRAATSPAAAARSILSGVRTTTIALAVVAVAVLLIWFGRRPR